MEGGTTLQITRQRSQTREDPMAKHKKPSTRKASKTRDLPVRKASSVKGGGMLNDVVKNIGGALGTAARK